MKDINMTEEAKEDFDNINKCRFCEKEMISDKVRDHCHLTGKYRGPAHNTCIINVKQKNSNFIPFALHKIINYDCHMFFERILDLKNDRVKLKIFPKTNEKYISVTYGCIRFVDSYSFLSESLDNLGNKSDSDEFITLKKEFPDKWHYPNKKLAYPCQNFNIIDDYRKTDFFNKLKKNPDDEEIE